jgi:hypothetical protein
MARRIDIVNAVREQRKVYYQARSQLRRLGHGLMWQALNLAGIVQIQ